MFARTEHTNICAQGTFLDKMTSDYLDKLGKKTTIVCPDKIDEHFFYLKDVNKIKTVNFASFDFFLKILL